MQILQEKPTVSAWQLLRIWTMIGLQSFGGGASTVLLIQRIFSDRYGWITMEEYVRLWSLCVFTPGINLIALTVLIGRKLCGVPGIIASLVGLLVPSAAITCLIAAAFEQIQRFSVVQAILRGIIPATAGIMLLVGLNFASPLILKAYKEGPAHLSISLLLIIACTLAIIVVGLSVIPVLLCSALLSMLFFTPWRAPQETLASSQMEEEHD